jgi:hypothetical protein
MAEPLERLPRAVADYIEAFGLSLWLARRRVGRCRISCGCSRSRPGLLVVRGQKLVRLKHFELASERFGIDIVARDPIALTVDGVIVAEVEFGSPAARHAQSFVVELSIICFDEPSLTSSAIARACSARSALRFIEQGLLQRAYSRRQLFANAAIASSRVASYPCAGCRATG